jgi:hypothetical protein
MPGSVTKELRVYTSHRVLVTILYLSEERIEL